MKDLHELFQMMKNDGTFEEIDLDFFKNHLSRNVKINSNENIFLNKRTEVIVASRCNDIFCDGSDFHSIVGRVVPGYRPGIHRQKRRLTYLHRSEEVDAFKNPANIVYIWSLFTSDKWGEKTDFKVLKACMLNLIKNIFAFEIKRVAIPAIGCGLGGLNFNIHMLPLITLFDSIFSGTDIYIDFYTPLSSEQDATFEEEARNHFWEDWESLTRKKSLRF